jgi:hypothetical protein
MQLHLNLALDVNARLYQEQKWVQAPFPSWFRDDPPVRR